MRGGAVGRHVVGIRRGGGAVPRRDCRVLRGPRKIAFMVITAILKGCHRALYGPLPEGPQEGTETGLVLVADGVGGFGLCGMGTRYAVERCGSGQLVRVLEWGHGTGRWYRDLSRTANHVHRSAQLAQLVRRYREEHPERPIALIGKSGGTGIVVWALERLDANVVDRAVLLAPALSPDYDLSRALRAVREEMLVYWSPLDFVILGLGTWLFGTIDRVRGVSAGLVGFRRPADADAALYETKLRQARWRPCMVGASYFGGHLGPDNPRFLQRYVIPRLGP